MQVKFQHLLISGYGASKILTPILNNGVLHSIVNKTVGQRLIYNITAINTVAYRYMAGQDTGFGVLSRSMRGTF